MLRHLNRKSNEVVLMKCISRTCAVCAGESWQANKVHLFLEKRKFKLSRPEESEPHPGHYTDLLELCQLPSETVKDDDQNQPSVDQRQQRCTMAVQYTGSRPKPKRSDIFQFCMRTRNLSHKEEYSDLHSQAWRTPLW